MLKRYIVRSNMQIFKEMGQRSPRTTLSSYLYSIWLFTYSDIKTIIIPTTLFGLANAIAAESFDLVAINPAPIHMIGALFRSMSWVYINLLPFAINNQRHPEAIAEDAKNKAWRTLPSGRMTPLEATRLMIVFHLVAIVASCYIGGLKQCLVGILLGFWYNNLRGSDRDFVTRNLINALGFIGFISGSLEVALGYTVIWTPKLAIWFLLIAIVVFSTVHSQDMHDQAGDAVRGRKTLPLVAGDSAARIYLATVMLVWGIACPWPWTLPIVIRAAFFGTSAIIAYRYLAMRSQKSDTTTFLIWNSWMLFLYILPFIQLWVGKSRGDMSITNSSRTD